MINSNEWIDVSATISDGMVKWPTDPGVELRKVEQIGVGKAIANVTKISCSAHLGTHIDAPLHFIPGGADVASVGLSKLIGSVKLFHITDREKICLDEIRNFKITSGDRVLFRTHNSDNDWERMAFNEHYVYLATDAAHYLADVGILCIGVDYLSVGGRHNNPEVHRLLLSKSIVIIEGLKLGGIDEGAYEMICLPLKLKDSDGGPSRVVIKKINT